MNKKIKTVLLINLLSIAITSTSFAAEKTDINDEDNSVQIEKIQSKIDDLKGKSNNNYNVEQAVAALYKELQELKKQNDNIKELEDELSKEKEKNSKLESKQDEEKEAIKSYLDSLKNKDSQEIVYEPKATYSQPVQPTDNYLLNPAPAARINGYIQDAANAQGNARMVFAYAPQQVYKIYCKIGYLTDLEFKQGEKIIYVGGGDTAQWILDKSIVNDTPHIYIKPVANNIATNIIVNTSGGHVYQILLNSGNWYNPMISWNYGNEDEINRKKANNAYQDDSIYPAGKSVNLSPENINFNYKIKAKEGKLPDWAPTSVFDDGEKTYIKFNNTTNKLPVLFIKERDAKNLSLANYRQKNTMFIVDKIFDTAQLQISNDDKDIVILKRQVK